MIQYKVPTKVAYKAGIARMRSWGFNCPSIEDIGVGMAVKDMFKFYLDKRFLNDTFENNLEAAPGTIDDVMSWYSDFLSALYDHIVKCLQDKWPVDFDLKKVEYIFGLPTSWKDNVPLVQLFRQIVEKSGFGTGNVIIRLTEGEASAVFTAKNLEHKFKVSYIHILVTVYLY
jgi:hypothetical protein